ncbi:MAG: methylmalonyl-CoA epimerase [Candidatus Hydrogenedentota bacterium]
MLVNHIAIAVKNIDKALEFYKKILGLSLKNVEIVKDQGVKVAILECDNITIELLEPLHQDSSLSKFINKKGEGLHHIAFSLKNVEKAINELKEKGIRLIDEKPKTGASGKKIAFIHPESANSVLVEFCENT